MDIKNNKMDSKRINQNIDRMMLLFEASNEGLFDMDFEGNTRFYNNSFYSKFDLDLDSVTLDDWKALIHPEDAKIFESNVDEQISNNISTYKSQYKVMTRIGNYIWIEAYAIAEFDDDGNLEFMVGSHRDVTEQKVNEDRIYNLAYVDGLTGLYNRSKLNEMLIMHLSTREPGALIYLNINQFKLVNDTYGEDTGNRVLIRVAERLKHILNENCVLFRIHADEFAILITHEISTELLRQTISELQDIIEGRLTLRDKVLDISTSVGVCELPMDVKMPDELIHRAKLTMRYGRQLRETSCEVSAERQHGNSRCTFFDASVQKAVMQELHIETGLRSALENNELYLKYQPIVNADTGEVSSFEALLRWHSEAWGEIFPDQFIPVAEKNLEIIGMGKFVMVESCKFIKQLREETGKDIKVSVNVSVIQLVQTNFVETVTDTIKEIGIEPSALMLEITESLVLDTNEFVIDRLRVLDELGVIIALDDFGTGYSSVNNLMTIPMKTLKVDRMVMLKAMDSVEIKRFVTSVVKLCHEMELMVVAEGIEDDLMVEKAKDMKVDLLQGYLYSRPLAESDARDYVLNQ